MLVELRFLRHVIELARYGNYARAASALNLSQPALSRSISTLEAHLKVSCSIAITSAFTPPRSAN